MQSSSARTPSVVVVKQKQVLKTSRTDLQNYSLIQIFLSTMAASFELWSFVNKFSQLLDCGVRAEMQGMQGRSP